jgi:hypothetical protein
MHRTRWRGKKLTGERDSGEAVLMVDGGGAPVVPGGEEDADAMQNWMVNLGVWSVTTNASCSDGEWRLETGQPRVWSAMELRWSLVSSYELEQF